MKYFIICCLIFFSCTDDRSLETEDFEASPVFETNVFQTQYTAQLINAGNESNPNQIRDFIDINIFNESFNDDLVSLEFEFRAENSIDREQTMDFIFFDSNDVETYRITLPIAAGTVGSPNIENFTVVLDPLEIDKITTSVRAEIFVEQPTAASNSGDMRLDCIVEAGYLFTGG